MQLTKAIRSWSVTFSSSLMRVTLKLAFLRMILAAALGMRPNWAWASQAAISTSIHRRNLFSSDQIWPMAGRVYRLIIGLLFVGAGLGNKRTKRPQGSA